MFVFWDLKIGRESIQCDSYLIGDSWRDNIEAPLRQIHIWIYILIKSVIFSILQLIFSLFAVLWSYKYNIDLNIFSF